MKYLFNELFTLEVQLQNDLEILSIKMAKVFDLAQELQDLLNKKGEK